MAYKGRNDVTKEVCIFVKSNLHCTDDDLREEIIDRYGLEYAVSTIHRIRMGEYDVKMNLPDGPIEPRIKNNELYDSSIYYKNNSVNSNHVYRGHSAVSNRANPLVSNNNSRNRRNNTMNSPQNVQKRNYQQNSFYEKESEKSEKNKEEYIIGFIAAFIGIGGILNGALENIGSIIVAAIFLGVAWKCFFK